MCRDESRSVDYSLSRWPCKDGGQASTRARTAESASTAGCISLCERPRHLRLSASPSTTMKISRAECAQTKPKMDPTTSDNHTAAPVPALASALCSAAGGPWTYSRYRATLKKNGKTFAIVSPDGRNALSDADTETLLRALNSEIWQPANTAPKGPLIIADFGWPWPVMATWCDRSNAWAAVSVQREPDRHSTGVVAWFETERESARDLRRWMPWPSLPNGRSEP